MTEPAIDFSHLSADDLAERAVSLGLPPGAFTARVLAGIAARIDASRGCDACWPCLGARQGAGYGVLTLGRTSRGAHRVVYVLANGPLADRRQQVRHDCDNPPCCNPAHLRSGTAKENSADALARGRHRAGPYLTKAERDFVPRLVDRLARGRRRRGRRMTRVQMFGHVAAMFEVSAGRVGAIYDDYRRDAELREPAGSSPFGEGNASRRDAVAP